MHFALLSWLARYGEVYVARLRRAVAGGAPEKDCLDTDDAGRYEALRA